jgi:hypothetical protein
MKRARIQNETFDVARYPKEWTIMKATEMIWATHKESLFISFGGGNRATFLHYTHNTALSCFTRYLNGPGDKPLQRVWNQQTYHEILALFIRKMARAFLSMAKISKFLNDIAKEFLQELRCCYNFLGMQIDVGEFVKIPRFRLPFEITHKEFIQKKNEYIEMYLK